ncbi:helix-turn-helix transcriptional regulator [Anabaena sphaerica FACHB-251]|uniref:Helix-turn-helix transcriptional regulator n=1 Tax=Anabaena sphaerica FACHB-251 TaxID=2692883 RepID=A0A926WPK9_9NOST|nr:helix-turn-helix transcriptional regulator [Anabaena sphaerica]MBD2296968.1 helix-turn-helix transcriptional regulator [Anabaena sphaerica FACHB-251]
MLKQPEVSHLIRQLRQLTALSQEQLAATLGVAYSTVNRWENGHIKPSALALNQIRNMLKELKDSPEITLQECSQMLLEQYFPETESTVR